MNENTGTKEERISPAEMKISGEKSFWGGGGGGVYTIQRRLALPRETLAVPTFAELAVLTLESEGSRFLGKYQSHANETTIYVVSGVRLFTI